MPRTRHYAASVRHRRWWIPDRAIRSIAERLGERDHIKDNLRVFSFNLSSIDSQEIASACARLTPISGDCGDEYQCPPYLTSSGDLSHHFDALPSPCEPTTTSREGAYVRSGTPWEELASYARAVRKGRRILVSRTTASHGDRLIGGNDPAAQTYFVIDKIEGAIRSLGGRLEDVVRTRVFVRRIEDWEPVARAHGACFGTIMPANTLVQATLIGSDYLVEMEAEAILET